MVDKNTTEFSRESFKEKILRQLEEESAKKLETKFPALDSRQQDEKSAPSIEYRRSAETPKVESRKVEPRKVELEPFELPVFDFPKDEEDEISPNSGVRESTTSEGSLQKKLEAMTLEAMKAQAGVHYSRTQARKQIETLRRQAEENSRVGETKTDSAAEISRENSLQKESLSSAQAAFETAENDSFPEVDAVKENSRRQTSSKSTRSPRTVNMTTKGKKNPKDKKKKRVTAGKIIAVIVVLLILVIGGTGWYGYNYVKSGVEPLDKNNQTMKAIDIPAGSSSKQIGEILQRDGIIKNGMIFQYYTKFKNYTEFKSGYYNLAPNMSLSTIASKLEKGGTEKPVAPTLGKILIPEGYTLEQISKAITINSQEKKAKTPFTTAEFMKTVQDPAFIAKMAAAYPNLFASLPTKESGVKYQLEGYLFPATYDYTKSSTVESVIENMIAAMNAQLTPYYDTIASKNLSVNEVLSLAALVEKEANNDDDRRNVSGTFFNRMNAGMDLGSNSAVLYAQGQLGEKTTLEQDATIDTNLDSPYNLYLNTGFGPGPIDSPSLSSIEAVLKPTDNDYLYFVADVTTGKVYFAQTLDEQNANVQKYVNDKINK
ncbi:endolytic transglycosylase MltG [Lactococcus kimchii]|uniref:endolytic transglycosylase MltG n=1 Tax=Lactococcus sp. S-13 TaxID=2507158 RepID=UPI0016805532|nr:endolytic transglycosylase MltG [Lactococcus sp. S-13]